MKLFPNLKNTHEEHILYTKSSFKIQYKIENHKSKLHCSSEFFKIETLVHLLKLKPQIKASRDPNFTEFSGIFKNQSFIVLGWCFAVDFMMMVTYGKIAANSS